MTQTTNDKVPQLLAKALAANQFEYDAATTEKLLNFLYLLERWNQVFNLTAIRDIEEMIPLHLLDSLVISPFLHGDKIIDVGTGAGLPGIPLALIHPEKQFFLLDSNGKKTRFLNQAKVDLGIKNIEVVHARCEDYSLVPAFDSIVSRAFSSIPVMLAKTQHLAAPDGQFIAMKGVYPGQEIEQIPDGFRVRKVQKLTINGLTAQRHVVCIQKL